jgi:hypothetical protein
MCLIVVPLPLGKKPFAFKINNNKYNGGGGCYSSQSQSVILGSSKDFNL